MRMLIELNEKSFLSLSTGETASSVGTHRDPVVNWRSLLVVQVGTGFQV